MMVAGIVVLLNARLRLFCWICGHQYRTLITLAEMVEFEVDNLKALKLARPQKSRGFRIGVRTLSVVN